MPYPKIERWTGRVGSWMQTFSGKQFWPLDPRPDEVCIEDIAHHLSMVCRYNGACHQFYSVAQHSVLVSDNLPKHLALVGLLHDAAEAYAGDMIRPLKRHLAEYQKVIERIEFAVAVHFGIPYEDRCPHPEVKIADNRAIVTEQRDIMAPPPVPWEDQGVLPFEDTIEGWSPHLAETMFLARYRELVP